AQDVEIAGDDRQNQERNNEARTRESARRLLFLGREIVLVVLGHVQIAKEWCCFILSMQWRRDNPTERCGGDGKSRNRPVTVTSRADLQQVGPGRRIVARVDP